MKEMKIVNEGKIRTVKIGDTVDVSDPKHGDSTHYCSFTGTVVKFEKCFIIVEDQNFNCFAIEQDEIDDVY